MMYASNQWYLVQCKPRQSFRAENHLINQGYTCFHPTYPIRRKIAGEMRLENSPLFPHYLFLLLSDNDNWSAIRSTRGVSRLVSFNGLPASLPHAIIEQLQIHCEKLHGGTPAPIYQVGQRVLITDGCFKELEAIVTANNGDERVVLLLNLFSRQQEVELSVSAVEACA